MKSISNAELRVMNIIWKRKRVTAKEIIMELNIKKWNNSTIRTLINRLVNKKVVQICKRDNEVSIYIPILKENEYKNYISKEFINQLFHGSIFEFVEFLMQNDEKYCKEIRELKNRL